ncbi:AAA-ATPase like domain containing protein, partial [Asbolus verrucosus]
IISKPKEKVLMEDGSLGDSSPESGPSNPEKDLFAFNTSKFEEIVKLESFVDKSLFIKAFFQTKDPVLVTAPSRFGKSTNMNILKQFLLGNFNS